MDIIILSILQLSKLRGREVQQLALRHTALEHPCLGGLNGVHRLKGTGQSPQRTPLHSAPGRFRVWEAQSSPLEGHGLWDTEGNSMGLKGELIWVILVLGLTD